MSNVSLPPMELERRRTEPPNDSESINLIKYRIRELADDNEKTYCLVVAVKAAIVNRDTEPVAINLLEVLEKRLESNEQFSDLLAGLPEKGVSHEK